MPESVIESVKDLDTELQYSEDEKGARTYRTRHLITVVGIVYQTRDTISDPWVVVDQATYDAETDPQLKQTLSSVTEDMLLLDPSMPVPHVTTLAADAYATCRTRKLAPWENAFQWYLTITWTTHREAEHEDRDPFARTVYGSLKCTDKEVPAFVDAKGRLCANAAGDLYKGLTKTVNFEIAYVTYWSAQWPSALRALNNTVNSVAMQMFGVWHAPRTLWMKNLQLPDVPGEQWGEQLWKTTYEIHHDPAGFAVLRPNAGLHELQYWTRTEDDAGPPRTFNDWVAVDFATYDAESDDDLKRITRERIETNSQQSTASEVWLTENGEATTPSLVQPTGITASVTDGDATVTLTGGTIDDTYVGTKAVITFTNYNGVQIPLPVRIASVDGGGASFEPHGGQFKITASGLPIAFAGSGAIFNLLEMQHEADWSALPLPLPAEPPTL
ncbi:MAG: hypothetical protein Fues2KO_47200 [Fuerstiella sp.]